MLAAKDRGLGCLCQAVPSAGLAQGDEECSLGLKNKQKTVKGENVRLWLVERA